MISSSISEAAIWHSTIPLRRLQRRCLRSWMLPPSLSAGARSVRVVSSAGARPNTKPVKTVSPIVNISTRASGFMSKLTGIGNGILICDAQRNSHTLTINPSTPAATATSMLSVINWRINRARLAPNANRTAISRRRPAARASIMFATLEQAISTTKPAITIRNSLKNGRSCFRMGSNFPPDTKVTRLSCSLLSA